MILITHDIGLVASMADRVIVMYAGQMIEEAPVKELFAAPAHPYTKALLQTVPGIYDEKDRELVAIPGMVPENYDSIPGCRFADRCAFRTKRLRSASELQTDRGRTFCQMYARQRRRNVKMSINMEEKNTEKEPLIRVENLKNIIPSGAALLPIRQAMCIRWTAFPFRLQREKPSVWWANPAAANRRWADSWSAWKSRRAAGCFIMERIWRSFPEKRKERAHAAADGVPGPIFFPESEKAYL